MAKQFSTVDDWLDEKKKVDGAEQLWRIHDKLYDFTLWSRIHPGGKFWLDVTRGTDITEAFENHHFSNNVESLLGDYYKRKAITPRNYSTTFDENGFFKEFKRKVLQQRLVNTSTLTLNVQLIADGLAAMVFLTAFMGVKSGITWTIISGLLLGILSIACHKFLHMKDNWRAFYFNLSLMSSREWKIRHVLSHHQYRDTPADLESRLWQPFSESSQKITNLIRTIANGLFFFVASHVQFLQRCSDVFLSKKLGFHPEELVALSFLMVLFLLSKVSLWNVFLRWNLIVSVGSFVFCFISSTFYKPKNQSLIIKNNQRDFGIVQLSLTGNRPKENDSVLSFLNAFRGNVLHYLCPTFNSASLSEVLPVLEETMKEFGISYTKCDKELLEGLSNTTPRGHVFFS